MLRFGSLQDPARNTPEIIERYVLRTLRERSLIDICPVGLQVRGWLRNHCRFHSACLARVGIIGFESALLLYEHLPAAAIHQVSVTGGKGAWKLL